MSITTLDVYQYLINYGLRNPELKALIQVLPKDLMVSRIWIKRYYEHPSTKKKTLLAVILGDACLYRRIWKIDDVTELITAEVLLRALHFIQQHPDRLLERFMRLESMPRRTLPSSLQHAFGELPISRSLDVIQYLGVASHLGPVRPKWLADTFNPEHFKAFIETFTLKEATLDLWFKKGPVHGQSDMFFKQNMGWVSIHNIYLSLRRFTFSPDNHIQCLPLAILKACDLPYRSMPLCTEFLDISILIVDELIELKQIQRATQREFFARLLHHAKHPKIKRLLDKVRCWFLMNVERCANLNLLGWGHCSKYHYGALFNRKRLIERGVPKRSPLSALYASICPERMKQYLFNWFDQHDEAFREQLQFFLERFNSNTSAIVLRDVSNSLYLAEYLVEESIDPRVKLPVVAMYTLGRSEYVPESKSAQTRKPVPSSQHRKILPGTTPKTLPLLDQWGL